MVKIEVKLNGEPTLYRQVWDQNQPRDGSPWTGKEEIEKAWNFTSKAENGKWPDPNIGGQRESEWTIEISKDYPTLNGIKIEYKYTVVLKDDGWNYEEKDYDYIYEIEFDENAGIVDEKNRKMRKFWKNDKGITNFTKKKDEEDKDSKDSPKREREQNYPTEIWNTAIRANY